MVNECIPFYEAAYTQKLTAFFTNPVAGKRFCAPLGAYQGAGPGLAADPLPANDGGNLLCAGYPAAGGEVGGIIGWDVADDTRGPVIRGAGTMLPVTSGEAINSGDEIASSNAGKAMVAGAGDRVVGKAHSTVAGADLDVVVELYALSAAVVPGP